MVESEILTILRQRFEDCMLYERPDHLTVCKPILDQYKDAEEAWFIKCKLFCIVGELLPVVIRIPTVFIDIVSSSFIF